MSKMVVINLNNPYALIVMAHVSENADNPYSVFCEIIKYCVFSSAKKQLTLSEAQELFTDYCGIKLPNNVLIQCLSIIKDEGCISVSKNHTLTKSGSYNIVEFERSYESQKSIEDSIINDLINFAKGYQKNWDFNYAREQLIGFLDNTGFAHNVLLGDYYYESESAKSSTDSTISDANLIDEKSSDENGAVFPDRIFVGLFIDEILKNGGTKRDYLTKICEGLMVTVGAYQLSSTGAKQQTNIKGTEFYFDTRLLLRLLGCAGKAAVEAAQELAELIQNEGGKIVYFPHTFEEINHAFDEAINWCSGTGSKQLNNEMRIFVSSIGKSTRVLSAKKASFKAELETKDIFQRGYSYHSDKERIDFGFGRDDLEAFMEKNLNWDIRVIENDARSIWETHMNRSGDYSEYCGTRKKLCVFVTNNQTLCDIPLRYKKERPSIRTISGWCQNRLPIISDIRLTCRLWSPSNQAERLSLLYLSAGVIAAQRPTKEYYEKIRKNVAELKESVPAYSEIPLQSFFDDNFTNAIIEKTQGQPERIDVGLLATTIEEMTEWKAIEEQKKTQEVQNQLKSAKATIDELSTEATKQKDGIINSAINAYKNKIGFLRIPLFLSLHWEAAVSILFSLITVIISTLTNNWNLMWLLLLFLITGVLEKVFASKQIKKLIFKRLLPYTEAKMRKRIQKLLRENERPYEKEIINGTLCKTKLLSKCNSIMNE